MTAGASDHVVTSLRALHAGLTRARLPLEVPGAVEARERARAAAVQLADYVIPRAEQFEAPLLAVVGGSTGAGKSTLVNSLVGQEVSRASAIRPTTRRPVLVHHPDDAGWFLDERVLPSLARVHGTAEQTDPAGHVTELELVAADRVPRGLALLDAPDIDSVVVANRQLAGQLLAAADLWIFLTTAARYADAVPWALLRGAAARRAVVAVVLDRVPPGTAPEVRADLSERLHAEGALHGLLGVGGSSGSAVASQAMQVLPVGVPKLLVSTMAAGDVSPYVGAKDVTIMPSVVDVAGINRISRSVMGNAVAAIAGMATAYAETAGAPQDPEEPHLIGATMFGLTTPAVDEARKQLTELGYEVLVFHATGAGGRAMEALAADGFLDGVLDLTTTELVDDMLGGVLSAGPDRLEAVGAAGLPQVVSVGALDMCNFGPEATVPDKYAGRNFIVHNPTVTLMRTTPEEMAELGRRIGRKLAQATGPVEVFLPLRGVSGIDVDGGPFFDPDADAACFTALKEELAGTDVVVHEVDSAINDEGFGLAAADALHALIRR